MCTSNNSVSDWEQDLLQADNVDSHEGCHPLTLIPTVAGQAEMNNYGLSVTQRPQDIRKVDHLGLMDDNLV